MTIDNLRCEMNYPHWYSRAGRPTPMEPAEHTADANNNRMVRHNESILNAAADHWESAVDYKALYICELNRGDHENREPYSAQELDKAKADSAFWFRDKRDPQNAGGITMRYSS